MTVKEFIEPIEKTELIGIFDEELKIIDRKANYLNYIACRKFDDREIERVSIDNYIAMIYLKEDIR